MQQKWQAKQQAKHTGTLTKLQPIAKEINTRLEKAAGLDGKANDHRLAVAIQLKMARQICQAAKISFPGWVKANVDKSYDYVKKLITVAAKPEPAKALKDMRADAAARNRQLRKRQGVSRDTPAPTVPIRAIFASVRNHLVARSIFSARSGSMIHLSRSLQGGTEADPP